MNKTIFLLHCHFRSRNWTIGFFCSLCQSKKRKRGWKCCLAELQVVKLFVVGGITTIATEIVHQNVFTVRVVFEWVDSFRSWWSYCLGTRQSLSVVMFFRRSESVPTSKLQRSMQSSNRHMESMFPVASSDERCLFHLAYCLVVRSWKDWKWRKIERIFGGPISQVNVIVMFTWEYSD
jgi:hypothetical protein